MKCKSCNSELYGSSNVCRNCGAVNEEYVSKSGEIASSVDNRPVFSTDVDVITKIHSDKGENRLYKEFIGKNAETIIAHMSGTNMNVWAYLFGPFYFVYRKLYLPGYIICIVTSLIGMVINIPVLILAVIQSFMFYPLYKEHVRSSIESIRNDNIGCSENELIEKVKAAGGTSIPALFGFLVFLIIFAFITTFLF